MPNATPLFEARLWPPCRLPCRLRAPDELYLDALTPIPIEMRRIGESPQKWPNFEGGEVEHVEHVEPS